MTKPPATPRRRPSAKAQAARVQAIFDRFAAGEGHPKTELNYTNPFTLLVAVALSAQATDKSVNKATDALFKIAATPAAMAALGVGGLTPFIQSIGLYRTKAKNVIALSNILLEQHGGQVPLEREALMALPGVGRKTASVVLNELDIEPAIAVDTHVYRVAHRLQLAEGSTPDKVEAQLMAVVPAPYLTRAHHWLILHGRYVCVARKPKCDLCIVADLCPSRALFMGA
jgi:endonuclease-3